MTSNKPKRRSGRLNFLLVVLALHIPLFAYPILRICGWLGLSVPLTLAIFLPLFFSQIVARIALRDPVSPFTRALRWAADIWLGVSPLVLGLVLLAEIPVAMAWLAPETAALSILVMAGLLVIVGIHSAHSPATVTVRLASDKLPASKRFVQISDVHIGSRSKRFLEHVIDRVNSLEPDFLCITGDFIDATGISQEYLGALTRVQGPIYFSIGNHEKYEDLEEIVQRLRNLGVNVLRNQCIHDEHLQVIGIDDMEDHGQVERQLAKMEIHDHKYVLLLYHRPRGHEAAAAAGVDLMLSGHTHNGQIMPFNLVVNRVFEKAKGLFLEDRTHLYVSSGTGTWGPYMRLGTRGEITLFEVSATRGS